ncbi:myristylated membrane protein-like protein [Dasineura jujubifolia toursvirus 2a]|nr:myristylated membrane protein-like protein [Dasineura jujubifolia toursvirus 2a]
MYRPRDLVDDINEIVVFDGIEQKIPFSRDEPLEIKVINVEQMDNIPLKDGNYQVELKVVRNNTIIFSRIIASIQYTSPEILNLESVWEPTHNSGDSILIHIRHFNETYFGVRRFRYYLKFRSHKNVTITNYKDICTDFSKLNCPIDPATNKPMEDCLNWRRSDEFGRKCALFLKDDHVLTDLSIGDFCLKNPSAVDCRCENRYNNQEYKTKKKTTPLHDYCWYTDCSSDYYLVKKETKNVDCGNSQNFNIDVADVGGSVYMKDVLPLFDTLNANNSNVVNHRINIPNNTFYETTPGVSSDPNSDSIYKYFNKKAIIIIIVIIVVVTFFLKPKKMSL